MNNSNYILMAIALLVVFYCIAVIIQKGKWNNSNDYDERQLAARSFAYRFAFITSVVYLSASEIYSMYLGFNWSDHKTNLSLGISIPIFVFITICIFKDAYLGYNQKPSAVCIPLFIIGLANIGLGIYDLYNDNFRIVFNNQIQLSVNLISGILLTFTAVLIILKFIIDRER